MGGRQGLLDQGEQQREINRLVNDMARSGFTGVFVQSVAVVTVEVDMNDASR